jgi:hypothetical protein
MAGAGPHAHLAGNVLTENGDLACLGTDGAGMVKLDKMTGATVWTAEELSDTAAYSSITVADVQGVRTAKQAVSRFRTRGRRAGRIS